MGDNLMECGTSDYKTLAEKYGNFHVPAVRVKIGMTLYSSVTAKKTNRREMLLIHQLDAWLYHAEGSSVSVIVGDVYDLEASQFKETAVLGEKMRVEIGYGSAFQEIFTGYVGEIQFQYFGTKQYVRITGFDAVTLMVQNDTARCYLERKYANVVSEIIGNYRAILESGKIDETGEQPQPMLSCYNMSDYACIRDILCPLAGKEFYIFNGKAYFQKVENRNQIPIIQLKIGQSLFDFEMTASYANLEVAAASCVGADSENKISGTVKMSMDASQRSAVSAVQKQYIPLLRVSDTAAVENYAAYWMQQRIAERQLAEGRCIGLPEIVPGRCISVSGIQPDYESKKFWIDHVHHKVGEDGFSTEFYVKGWS